MVPTIWNPEFQGCVLWESRCCVTARHMPGCVQYCSQKRGVEITQCYRNRTWADTDICGAIDDG